MACKTASKFAEQLDPHYLEVLRISKFACLLRDGRVLFCSTGISADSAPTWGVYWRKPSGSFRRFCAIPLRGTLREAQEELALYAIRKRLRFMAYEEVVKCLSD